MALVASLNTAVNAMLAYQAALQTTGHNVSNATTPGFSRQRVEFATQRPQDFQRFEIGRGVLIGRVRRLVDKALEERLRDSKSALGEMTARSESLQRLEAAFDALSGQDLGTSLSKFFDSLEDLSLHPESIPTRRQVIGQGGVLADRMRDLADNLRISRDRLNDEVNLQVGEINRILEEMADLNKQVLVSENGGIDIDSANDLRDRREQLLKDLSERIGVKGIETSKGELNVLVGSSFLVFGSVAQTLDVEDATDLNSIVSTVVFADGTGILPVNGGQLKGLLDSRDVAVRGALRDLNVLSNSLVREINTAHAGGLGLERYRVLTSEDDVADPAEPLAYFGSATSDSSTTTSIVDSSKIGFAGTLIGREILVLNGENALERRSITDFDPSTGTITVDGPFLNSVRTGDRYQVTDLGTEIQNGSFEFKVVNEQTGSTESVTINVNVLNDPLTADTLNSIAAQINAVDPAVQATVLADGRLRIESSNDNVRFGFGEDSSKLLAALGLARFFAGSSAFDLSMNGELQLDPKLLGAAQTTASGDSANAAALLDLRDQALVDGTSSFEAFYQGIVGKIGIDTDDVGQRLEHASLTGQQLENQRQRVSGVNLDEEATNMIVFQRAFQATARFVVVVDNLLETLISTV